MKRWIPVLVVVGLGLAGLFWARHSQAQDNEGSAQRGAALYAEYCQACHGPRGEAIGQGPAFVAVTYDANTSRDVIMAGQDTNKNDDAAMPPYLQGQGGPLTSDQISDLVAYMATWNTENTPPLPEPNIQAKVTHVPDYFGDPQAGAVVYAKFCYGCHGAEGQGRNERHFPAIAEAKNPIQAVSAGTGSPYMPAFAVSAGGPLSDMQLQNLDAYLASWKLKEPEQGPSAKGIDTLVVIMGVLAIGAVAWVYMMRMPQPKKTPRTPKLDKDR